MQPAVVVESFGGGLMAEWCRTASTLRKTSSRDETRVGLRMPGRQPLGSTRRLRRDDLDAGRPSGHLLGVALMNVEESGRHPVRRQPTSSTGRSMCRHRPARDRSASGERARTRLGGRRTGCELYRRRAVAHDLCPPPGERLGWTTSCWTSSTPGADGFLPGCGSSAGAARAGVVLDQRVDPVRRQLVAAAEEGQLDHERQADDLGAQLLYQVDLRLGGAAGGEQVIVDQHAGALRARPRGSRARRTRTPARTWRRPCVGSLPGLRAATNPQPSL